ncbi:MAG: M3 family oligoendopeptidase [bacterium]|nr:M3 family oligoendopeptidase [bacterium]
MNKRWNLESIYPSFSSPEFKGDLEKLNDDLARIKSFGESDFSANPDDSIKKYIFLAEEFQNILYRLFAFCSLTLSVDTSNPDGMNYKEILSKKSTLSVVPFTKFRLWLKDFDDLESLALKDDFIKSRFFHLKEIQTSAKRLFQPEIEDIVSDMQRTGSSAFSSLQNQLTSNLSVEVEIKGKKETLSLAAARNLYYDKDSSLRESVYKSELESYDKIKIPSAACLNAIKGEVLMLSKRRGYASPLEMTLEESRMDMETLNSLLDSMKDSLPIFRKYYKHKAKLLRGAEKIPYFDVSAPVGEVDIRFSYEEASDYIVNGQTAFSKETADFMRKAFNERWLDVEPRKGKRGGAFCSTIHSVGQSRILANFTGSFDNMTTLAHELGHAYHGYVLKDESILNSDYPMPLAETASIFSETVVMDYSFKNFSGATLLTLLENDISSSAAVIVDIYSRYLFETELFKERDSSILSYQRLNELMAKSQLDSYGDALDERFTHPFMWANKPHYYYSGSNFYNFPYAFGLLFAKGLYALYKKHPENFLEKYKTILKNTGCNDIYNVGLSAGIDLHKRKFFDDTIEMISGDIEKFLTMG